MREKFFQRKSTRFLCSSQTIPVVLPDPLCQSSQAFDQSRRAAIDQIKSLALWSKLWSKPNEAGP